MEINGVRFPLLGRKLKAKQIGLAITRFGDLFSDDKELQRRKRKLGEEDDREKLGSASLCYDSFLFILFDKWVGLWFMGLEIGLGLELSN